MLCHSCQEVSEVFYKQRSKAMRREYASRKALEHYARQCDLCTVIYRTVKERDLERVLEKHSDDQILVTVLRSAADLNNTSCTSIILHICSHEDYRRLFERIREAPPMRYRNLRLRIENPADNHSLSDNKEQSPWQHALPKIRSWIEQCNDSHHICAQQKSIAAPKLMPRRLLDLSAIDDTGMITLREYVMDMEPYITLSHRWGSIVTLKTTTQNINAMKSGFPIPDTSKTFRDAANLARLLGVKYLWIDSLCIVQDDKTDWRREASVMASVYQHAYLTLAASDAKNASEGLAPPAEPLARLTFDESIGKVSVGWERSYDDVCTSSLNSRAWVLQEWVLSPRTLHFKNGAIYWECQSRFASSDAEVDIYVSHDDDSLNLCCRTVADTGFFSMRARAAIYGSMQTWTGMYDVWSGLIEDYSGRSLTDPSDKFAAFAGLTSALKARVTDTPLAGLWRADLHLGLLWSSHSKQFYELAVKAPEWREKYIKPDWKPSLGKIPSWSWASYDGPVYFNVQRWGRRFIHSLEIVNMQVEESEDFSSSNSLSGVIKVKGILRQFVSGHPGWDECDICFDDQPQSSSSLGLIHANINKGMAKERIGLNNSLKFPKSGHWASSLRIPPLAVVAKDLTSCRIVVLEDGRERPVGPLHGRVSLDRPTDRSRLCVCNMLALLVTTELVSDTLEGRDVVPYLHHVLIVEPGPQVGDIMCYRRTGVGYFWAEYGYFENQLQSLICLV